jgi:hypothetical protein
MVRSDYAIRIRIEIAYSIAYFQMKLCKYKQNEISYSQNRFSHITAGAFLQSSTGHAGPVAIGFCRSSSMTLILLALERNIRMI